jgi:hypothetical protein
MLTPAGYGQIGLVAPEALPGNQMDLLESDD